MEITSGVARGSIIGPDLWNVSYNSLLRLDKPEESRLVGYADEVAALVAGRTVEQAQSRLGILMRRVSGWMTAHGFNLALEKNRSSHLDQKEKPDPAPHIDRRVDWFNARLENELLRTNQSYIMDCAAHRQIRPVFEQNAR